MRMASVDCHGLLRGAVGPAFANARGTRVSASVKMDIV